MENNDLHHFRSRAAHNMHASIGKDDTVPRGPAQATGTSGGGYVLALYVPRWDSPRPRVWNGTLAPSRLLSLHKGRSLLRCARQKRHNAAWVPFFAPKSSHPSSFTPALLPLCLSLPQRRVLPMVAMPRLPDPFGVAPFCFIALIDLTLHLWL